MDIQERLYYPEDVPGPKPAPSGIQAPKTRLDQLTEFQQSAGFAATGKPSAIALLGIAAKSGEVMFESIIFSAAVSPVLIAEFTGIADALNTARKELQTAAYKGNVVIEDPEKFKQRLGELVYYINAAAIEIGSNLDELAGLGLQTGVRKQQERIAAEIAKKEAELAAAMAAQNTGQKETEKPV